MLPAARELLRPDCEIKPAWAVFDADWYVSRYQTAREYCGGDASGALDYYLEIGVQLGHSPSPIFDERYYLAENPDVHELVRAGDYTSGFDHFCRHGHRVLSPHWLFDDALYGRLYDDMSLENLDQHDFYGRYDHYLRSGQHERRIGHFMFDPAFFQLRLIEAGVAADERGPFAQFAARLGNGAAELPPSIYFEPRWYLENTAGARAAIEAGHFRAAIEHYLCGDTADLRDPVPQFSEAYYRETYHDIGHAVDNGEFRSGYQHFVQFGAFELRRPGPEIDLVYYRDVNPRVRDDLNTGAVRDAFAHLRLVGLREGFAVAPPDAAPELSEAAAKHFFMRRARENLALFGRRALDFTAVAPVVSVIMVAFNRFELTMLALSSLRDNFAGAVELVLVDNASSDDTRRIGQYVTGAKLLVLPENIGFLRAANAGLAVASAPAVLYLNNDVELGHGAVAAALARLDGDEKIGAVGGKIVRSHGRLQEAGSIIWRDGSTTGYMRDAAPLAGEANFLRDVDYCSAVFLLCRRGVLEKLGGFDERFSPAYYEDADLCVRMALAGFRVVYDPTVVVHHLEFGSASHTQVSNALMRRGRQIFSRRHELFLRGKFEQSQGAQAAARSVAERRPRVLFLEDTVPLRRLGSGFVRANDVVRAIASACEVTVFPINGAPHDVMSLFGDLPETVECLHDWDINTLPKFLEERAGYFDMVWVSRTHNLGRVLPIFEAAGMSPARLPFVLDTEAVVAIRELASAALAGPVTDMDFDEAVRAEFAGAEVCRRITAVNRIEVDLLNSIGLPAVSMLGTVRAPALTPADFGARRGLLLVASIHQPDSPNLDSLNWYLDEILPALRVEMDEVPVLHFVGYTGPEIELSRFTNHPDIQIHGPVGDLRPFYDAARVFIAPTRFSAGTPYKVYEAASYGVPCVATDLLALQLGWAAGTDLLTAPVRDARRFAAQIAVLYRTETLWRKLRAQAAGRLAVENTQAAFNREVAEALVGALKFGRRDQQETQMAEKSPVTRGRRAVGKNPAGQVPAGEAPAGKAAAG